MRVDLNTSSSYNGTGITLSTTKVAEEGDVRYTSYTKQLEVYTVGNWIPFDPFPELIKQGTVVRYSPNGKERLGFFASNGDEVIQIEVDTKKIKVFGKYIEAEKEIIDALHSLLVTNTILK